MKKILKFKYESFDKYLGEDFLFDNDINNKNNSDRYVISCEAPCSVKQGYDGKNKIVLQ